MTIEKEGVLVITNPKEAQIQNLELSRRAMESICIGYSFREGLDQNKELFREGKAIEFAFKIDHSSSSKHATGSSANIIYVKVKPPKELAKSNEKEYQLVANSIAESFQLMPNPAQDKFQINFKNTADLVQTIEIYNLEGKVVQSVDFDKIQGLSIEVNVANLEGGMYIVRVTSTKESIVRKLVLLK